MSKLLLVMEREPTISAMGMEAAIKRVLERLEPDNIRVVPPQVVTSYGLSWGVMNPTVPVSSSASHVAVGSLLSPSARQFPDSPRPDGSFALARFNNDTIELISDVVGSRTVWWYLDEQKFIASTSQRAIVMMLGSFQFNRRVVSWCISNGTLGPVDSWDERIRRLPSNSTLSLDREGWSIKQSTQSLEFGPHLHDENECRKGLAEAISDSVSRLPLHWPEWTIPLSGGGDSRYLLETLKAIGAVEQGLTSVTWGAGASRNEPGNDAEVAAQVASYYNIGNIYLENDPSDEPINQVVDRFLRAGEGRIDHIAAYLDGMATWSMLFNRGICGTIRGDQAFGLPPVSDELGTRLGARLTLLDDLGNLRPYRHLDWPEQDIPVDLERREHETLEQWRDRLSLAFRIPTVLAALADIKLAYSEQVTPFLSERVVHEVLRTPDHLRTGKRVFKSLAADAAPNIPFARQGANNSPEIVFGRDDFREMLTESLNSAGNRGLLPEEFTRDVSQRIEDESIERKSWIRKVKPIIKAVLPNSVQATLRREVVAPTVSWRILAFRAHVIVRMAEILEGDAQGGVGLSLGNS